jgi:hypothetical protein
VSFEEEKSRSGDANIIGIIIYQEPFLKDLDNPSIALA